MYHVYMSGGHVEVCMQLCLSTLWKPELFSESSPIVSSLYSVRLGPVGFVSLLGAL